MTTFKEPANILLVDDDSRNLDVLESILSCQDYRLFRARTADEALLASARSTRPAVVHGPERYAIEAPPRGVRSVHAQPPYA